jgi:hypothetical protein
MNSICKKKNIFTLLLVFVCCVQHLACMNERPCNVSKVPSQAPVFEAIFGATLGECNLNHPKVIDGFCKKLVCLAVDFFKSGHLFMLDGCPGNDQCHMESLYLVELYKEYKAGEFFIDEARDLFFNGNNLVQIRFLALSFFLSSVFGPSEGTVRKGASCFFRDRQKLKIAPFFGNGKCRNIAQKELGDILFSYAKRSLMRISTEIVDNPNCLNKLPEHTKAIIEDISQMFGNGVTPFYLDERDKGLHRPRFPKFAGAFIFLVKAHLLNIPFVFNVKTICRNGVHYSRFQTTDDTETPAIIVEGVAFCDGLSYGDFNEKPDQCFHSLLRKNDKTHSENESCFLCRKCSTGCFCDGFVKQQHLLSKILAEGVFDLILPIAADFTHMHQEQYEKDFFSEGNSLSKCFAFNLKRGFQKGLCEINPSTFVIKHVHAATIATMSEIKTLFVDMRSEDCMLFAKKNERN